MSLGFLFLGFAVVVYFAFHIFFVLCFFVCFVVPLLFLCFHTFQFSLFVLDLVVCVCFAFICLHSDLHLN